MNRMHRNKIENFLLIIVMSLVAILVASCGGGSGSTSKPSGSASSSSVSSQVLSVQIDKQLGIIMKESGATAALVAIAKDGQIEYEQAYGFQDANNTIPLKTDTLMRTASIIKPVTAAAVRKLEATGVLSLSDHAFCNGSNAPCWLSANLLSDTTDSRAKDITIAHLIFHYGGWYRDVSGDPIGKELEIRDAIGISGPPSREDIVRFVMKQPLDYTPGNPGFDHDYYSNFGYMLLGLIIEQASHSSYVEYIQTAIMAQLGVPASDFKMAPSKLIDHDLREPVYLSELNCYSVFTLDKIAPCEEEGADMSNWAAVGLTITTARAMALFAQAYTLPSFESAVMSGNPLINGPISEGYKNGGFPGIRTLLRQLPSGVSYVVFVNADFNLDNYGPKLDRLVELAP